MVILHLDDLGIAHSANLAAQNIFNQTKFRTGSIIANSSWVPEMVSIISRYSNLPDLPDSERIDIGAHLTLNSEYTWYKWRPMINSDKNSGLVDEHGFLWPSLKESISHVTPTVAEQEMRAQIHHLLQLGLDLTHLDSHMFAPAHPKFLPTYVKLAVDFGIPAMIPIMTQQMFDYMGFNGDFDIYQKQISLLKEMGYPLFDAVKFSSLEPVNDKLKAYKGLIKSIKPGLTHLLFHPAIYNAELQAIDPKTSVGRFQDYEVLVNPKLQDILEKNGIVLYTYRELGKYFRKLSSKIDYNQL